VCTEKESQSENNRIQKAIEEARRLLTGAPELRFKTRRGRAVEEIRKEAASGDLDLVVVGARGRRDITCFLLGSTAERFARHAPVPVLIVEGARDAMRRVLICTVGKEPGLAAMECRAKVARPTGADVTVLHVMYQIAGLMGLLLDNVVRRITSRSDLPILVARVRSSELRR
jgi:nucleotide-binding universal stress UspA family protein